MSYTPNIPQATDNPSDSQSLILANYQQINTQFGTDLTTGNGGDHVLFTASSANGSHNRVTLLNQSASPAAVIQATANEVLIFAKTQSGITMPYYTRDNIASGTTTWPVSPIKAFASINVIDNNTVSIFDSFNVASVSTTTVGTIQTVTVNLTNACRSNNYGVLVAQSFRSSNTTSYQALTTTQFTVLINSVPLVAAYKLTVAVLET